MLFKIFLKFFFYLLLPLHILVVIFFFLKNLKIFKNNLIFPFFTWSFGHQVIAYDMASRIYNKKKISLIEIIHPRNNEYLSECYSNIKKFSLKSFFLFNKSSSNFDKQFYLRLIYFFLNLVNFFCNRKFILLEHLKIYNNKRINKVPLKQYDHISNKVVEFNSLTGFTNLIKLNVGKKPNLPIKYIKLIKKSVLNFDTSFNKKKTFTILFRKKRSNEYYDNLRDFGNEKKYFKLIKNLKKNNFNVVLMGDFDHKFFKKYDCLNIYNTEIFKNISPKIINLYFLLYSEYLMTQHSGAFCLTNSKGFSKTIIVDSFPFYLGTHSKKDRVLHKNVFFRGKKIRVKDIFNKDQNRLLRLGKIDNTKGYKLKQNTSQQIYNAMFNPKYLKLKFDKDLMIYYTKTKVLDL